jgi:hypothetical protein
VKRGREPLFTIERGLMPLLDVSILLLGLFLVLLAVDSARERDARSVLSGQAIVLLELIPDAEQGWLLSRIDADSGERSGSPDQLTRAAELVSEDLRERRRRPEDATRAVLVLVQFPDPFTERTWSASDGRTLQTALAGQRWVMVWGR